MAKNVVRDIGRTTYSVPRTTYSIPLSAGHPCGVSPPATGGIQWWAADGLPLRCWGITDTTKYLGLTITSEAQPPRPLPPPAKHPPTIHFCPPSTTPFRLKLWASSCILVDRLCCTSAHIIYTIMRPVK